MGGGAARRTTRPASDPGTGALHAALHGVLHAALDPRGS